MAKNSHVPKFGNWDNDNIPYTAFFENARKERAGVRMNPNDPEENPEAFMWGTVGLETDGDCQPVRAPRHVDSYKTNSAEKSRSRKSTPSEISSDKSKSDHSLPQPGHRRLKYDRNKGPVEGSNSFSPPVPPGTSRQRSGNSIYASDESHYRAASVPRFGAWDENDPKSGEGFTVIFNKVKEEKHIASTQFPVVADQTNNYSDVRRSNEGSSLSNKPARTKSDIKISKKFSKSLSSTKQGQTLFS